MGKHNNLTSTSVWRDLRNFAKANNVHKAELRQLKTLLHQHINASGRQSDAWMLGTFFSGWESMRMALEDLGLEHGKDYVQMFSVESDAACQKIIEANFEMHPKHQMHLHIESVDIRKLPSVDCFQFSPPCQPFSASGDLLGGEDARAALWTYALKYIKLHRPRLFIMENVLTLVQRFPLEFQKMLKSFRRVCKSAYLVQHMDWNAKEHGSPSNRPSVIILGFDRDGSELGKLPLQVPPPIPCPRLALFLDLDDVGDDLPDDSVRIRNLVCGLSEILDEKKRNPFLEHWAIDAYASPSRNAYCVKNRLPCITKARGSAGGFWLTKLNRMTTISELVRVQCGAHRKLKIPDGVSARQVGGMAGNAISVSVLVRLLSRALPAACLTGPVAER